jgi:hypothetical protein
MEGMMIKEEAKPRKLLTVYQAIASVTEKLAKNGISKDRKNEQQGYKFRGIDDVYNALAPFLAEANLCVLPSVLSRDVVERTNKNGGALFYVTVQVRFDFVSADDGTKHEVVTFGEAMDSGDKATNKAMSAAYKYACMQAFCIPTEGDNDADSATHEVQAAKSVFESPELRATFVANGLDALARATNLQEVKDQKDLNLARWNGMKGSGNAEDLTAYNTLVTAYNIGLMKFKKPTVESAKSAA